MAVLTPLLLHCQRGDTSTVHLVHTKDMAIEDELVGHNDRDFEVANEGREVALREWQEIKARHKGATP